MIVPTTPSIRGPALILVGEIGERQLTIAGGGDLGLDHRTELAVSGDEVAAEQAADDDHDRQRRAEPEAAEVPVPVGHLVEAGREHDQQRRRWQPLVDRQLQPVDVRQVANPSSALPGT